MRTGIKVRFIYVILFVLILIIGGITMACGGADTAKDKIKEAISGEESISVVDSADREVIVDKKTGRVVALTSSLADLWALSGGSLIATSSDTFRERPGLTDRFPDIADTGNLMNPNAEEIISLEPQLVIMSPELPAHKKLAPLLDEASIPYYYANIDVFEDYLLALRNFTKLTDRNDLYEEYGSGQQKKIEALIDRLPAVGSGEKPRVLFLRVSTTKVEAISKGHIVCDIIKIAGGKNIAYTEESVFQDLSLEAIVAEDPDFIFAVLQGADSAKSEAVLSKELTNSKLWSGLNAVQAGRFIELPKDLYHLKPNARWVEAYETLFKILFPAQFTE